MRPAIKKQGEDLLLLAEILAKDICNNSHLIEWEELGGALRLEACAVICVIALREVIVKVFSGAQLLNRGKILACGYDEFVRCVCKAGDKAYLGSFTKHWRVAKQILDVKSLFKHIGEKIQTDISHEKFWKSEFQFLAKESSTSEVLRNMYADKEWLEYFAIKIQDFCFRVHTVVNPSKWEVAMNTRQEQCSTKTIKPKYDVFITYRRSDGLNYAQLLYQALDKRGYKCFLDVRDQQDDEYEERIMAALHNAPNYIFLMTDGSLQRLSEDENSVYNEVHEALGLHKKIIPVAPSGMSRSLYGAEMLDEFNCLRALSVSRLETGEFFEESVDKIVQRFPVKIRRVRRTLIGGLFVLVIALSCMIVALWPKSHSLDVEKTGSIETNAIDKTVEPILKRMKEIRLPYISFTPPATIADAVEYFRAASKDFDRPDIPYEKRGLKFDLRHGEYAKSSFDNDDGDFASTGEDESESGKDSFASQADCLPVIPQLSASDITLYDALKLVCESVDYNFVVRNGEVIVKPRNLTVDSLATWIYEVDGRFEEILLSWTERDMTTSDEDSVGGDCLGNDALLDRSVMALSTNMGVTWWIGSGVRYMSSIRRLKVKNTSDELRRFEQFLSEMKVLKSVRKNP